MFGKNCTNNEIYDDDGFVGFRSPLGSKHILWYIPSVRKNRVHGYPGTSPVALLRIDLLGSSTCPVKRTDTREATSGFQTSLPLVG